MKRSSVPEGVKVIQVRWIDINKGDEEKPDIRSRLVAKDFNAEDRPELFAATPPTKAMRKSKEPMTNAKETEERT